MSRPKPNPQRADVVQANDGGGPAAGGADIRAAEGAAGEAATGAASASGAVPETAGPETDSSGPADPDQVTTLEPGEQVRAEEAVMARLYDASGKLLRTVMAGGPSRGVLTPAELCEQLGIEAEDVLAINLVAGVIVTRDGRKVGLADV